MIALQRIEADPVPAAALGPYAALVGAAGSAGFYGRLSRTLREALAFDRLYLIDGAAEAAPLIAESEVGKPPVDGPAYVRRFLPADPLRQALDHATDGAVLRLSVAPADIAVPTYRAMLERAGVVERISFVHRQGRSWRCMTVARRRASGRFEEGELALLGGLYRLVSPLVDRHRELTGEVAENREERLADLEQRFGASYPALTEREREVCARAAIGMSVEGAALDLGVAPSSVLTYRKRAYRRLGVSSAYELARLVMR